MNQISLVSVHMVMGIKLSNMTIHNGRVIYCLLKWHQVDGLICINVYHPHQLTMHFSCTKQWQTVHVSSWLVGACGRLRCYCMLRMITWFSSFGSTKVFMCMSGYDTWLKLGWKASCTSFLVWSHQGFSLLLWVLSLLSKLRLPLMNLMLTLGHVVEFCLRSRAGFCTAKSTWQ